MFFCFFFSWSKDLGSQEERTEMIIHCGSLHLHLDHLYFLLHLVKNWINETWKIEEEKNVLFWSDFSFRSRNTQNVFPPHLCLMKRLLVWNITVVKWNILKWKLLMTKQMIGPCNVSEWGTRGHWNVFKFLCLYQNIF